MAYTALGKRVQLQMNRGETFRAYLQEQPKENYASKIERAPIMQKMMKQELQVALKVLNDTESIARKVYQGLEKRSQAMIANLQTELSKSSIDRAIVYVGEDHCKSIIANLKPNTSYVVLIPDSERKKNLDFSQILLRQKKASGAESDIIFYRDLEEDFKNIPRKLCDNPLCRFTAPVISDRIVCLTSPGSQAVFYCNVCDKYYCGIELKPVFMSDEDFEALLSFNPSELFEVVEGKPPFSLQCRHCGNFVGKGERTAIWNISE
jgi:hypothetical protein